MKTPPLLLTLLLTCLYTNQVTATAQPPLETGATTSSSEATVDNDPLSQITISDEEKNYIDTECRGFAVDDEVTVDELPEYVALCNRELTIAVKTALLERRNKKKRKARTIRAKSRNADQPEPM